jgi:hypothetical protein
LEIEGEEATAAGTQELVYMVVKPAKLAIHLWL